MSAAQRIWAFEDPEALGGIPRAGDWIDEKSEAPSCAVEYIRADIHQSAIDAAVLAERERCAAVASDLLWPSDAELLANEIGKGPTP